MAQVITVVNKSGKIVKSTKTLAGVFNEAKSAYSERKAELKASRQRDREEKENEIRARGQLEAMTLDDDVRSRHSSRAGSRTGSEDRSRVSRRKPVPSSHHDRPPVPRGYSDSQVSHDGPPRRSATHRPSPLRFDNSGDPMYDDDFNPRSGELVRRHTGQVAVKSRSQPTSRRASHNDVDMDLAYGDMPPDEPASRSQSQDVGELKEKMTGLQRMLDEANCLQHSAGATIENLQKNPEALAAVGLTLAEISTMVTKLAPGALPGLKASFPAIMALLASPQFAIAAGLTIGVTIIAFGGYKIVKKIQANNAQKALLENGENGAAGGQQVLEPASPAETMDELRELSSVERWRRGIADEQARSVGTSVDGEFLTPVATKTLIEEGKLTEADFKPREKREKKVKSSKSRKAESDTGSLSAKSIRSERSSREKKERKEREREKKKEPSGLKLLFSGHSK